MMLKRNILYTIIHSLGQCRTWSFNFVGVCFIFLYHFFSAPTHHTLEALNAKPYIAAWSKMIAQSLSKSRQPCPGIEQYMHSMAQCFKHTWAEVYGKGTLAPMNKFARKPHRYIVYVLIE